MHIDFYRFPKKVIYAHKAFFEFGLSCKMTKCTYDNIALTWGNLVKTVIRQDSTNIYNQISLTDYVTISYIPAHLWLLHRSYPHRSE